MSSHPKLTLLPRSDQVCSGSACAAHAVDEMKNEMPEEQQRLSKDSASDSGWSLNEDGIACYQTHAGTRIFVPKSLRKLVLSQYHGNLLHGHYGVLRTMDRIAARFGGRHYAMIGQFILMSAMCPR
jgi:Integrase zinc binding domain